MRTPARRARLAPRFLSLMVVSLVLGSCGTSATDIAMQVFDVNPITTGTYAGFTITTGAVGAIIGYQDAAGIDFASGITPSEATIVITEFSATHVAGTFFGVLQESGEPDVVITEGSFRTARIN